MTLKELETALAAMKAQMDAQAKENAALKAKLAAKEEPDRLSAQLVLPYKGKTLTFALAVTRKAGSRFHVHPAKWEGKELKPIKGLLADAGKLYLEPAELDELVANAK